MYGPELLPDGETVLFTLGKAGTGSERWDKADIVVQSMKTGTRTAIIHGGGDARYLRTGHLVYAVGGVVFAARSMRRGCGWVAPRRRSSKESAARLPPR